MNNLKGRSYISFIISSPMLQINPKRECSSRSTVALDTLIPTFWKGFNFQDFVFIQWSQKPLQYLRRPIEIIFLSNQLTGRIWRSFKVIDSSLRSLLLSEFCRLEFLYLVEQILRQVVVVIMPLKLIFPKVIIFNNERRWELLL